MNRYRVSTRHDKGDIDILIYATDAMKAIDLVMKAELCPFIAIMSVDPAPLTISEHAELLGFEILKDTETDYYFFSAIRWVEESGLFDTEEEAAIEVLRLYGQP